MLEQKPLTYELAAARGRVSKDAMQRDARVDATVRLECNYERGDVHKKPGRTKPHCFYTMTLFSDGLLVTE